MKFRKWRLLAAFVSNLLGAAAGEAFEARVVFKASGDPVAGAEVSVINSNITQITSADGTFRWEPTPAVPFEVLVVLPGGRYMRPFTVDAIPADGPVLIEVEPIAEESVIVTAGAAPTVEATPANGTTIVPKPDIESRQPLNLTQAVENVAGVSSVSDGQAAVPAIRGLARGRSLILIDGARVSSERRVGPSATFMDPFLLDGVEVARGPGSVAYGSDAFGGVIAARTLGVAVGAPLKVTAIGNYGVGTPGGSVGASVAAPVGKDGGFLVAGHYRSYGNWDSPEGEVFNSGFRDSGILLRGSYDLGAGTLTAAWQGDYGRDIDRPRNNSTTVRFYYPEENSSRFTLAWETEPVAGFSRIAFVGLIGSYDQITNQYRFATGEAPATLEQADVSANDFQARAFAERFFGPVRVEVGVDFNGRYDLHALDNFVRYTLPPEERSNVSVDDARRTDAAGYLTAEMAFIPQLMLAGGVRYDSVTSENVGGYFGNQSTSNDAVSGSVALTAGSFGGFSATGQFSHGFRDPVLSDRYFRGPSGRGFITGNPFLVPETSDQWDVALRYAAGRFRTAFYLYDYTIHDLIERYSGENPDDFFFRNRGQARLRGLELEVQVDLPEGFAVALAGQIERGETVDDDAPLDDIPPESLNLQLRKQFGPAFVQARGVIYADDDHPGPTERARPGYGLLDLGAGYSFAEFFEVQAYVRNVLDKAYLITPDARAVLAPGISAVFTGYVRF
jgi:outer membrane receptor protein involved in Fe transport